VNNPFVIAQNDRMVAINSAIEVDLTGQVCSDSIGPKFYSGVGGQLDFIYGASLSDGGVPIIALPSTTTLRDGTLISRIVPMLKQGAGVVTTRNHVHYIATEFGMVDLYGKSVRQRTKLLISIAHPDFRDGLEHKAKELHYL
jgi:4-hydroxybutyrate CoA-transferase